MQFTDLTPYQLPGFTLRQLTPEDKPKLFAIRDAVMAALPDPRWYFSMEEWEIDEWLGQRSVVGYLDGDVLAGFAAITPNTSAAIIPTCACWASLRKTPLISTM